MFFGLWAETQLTLAKKFQHCCQNFIVCVQRYNLGIVLGQIGKVNDLLYFFERKVSRKGCQNCFSWLHRNILGRKFVFINNKDFCHFQTSSQKFMDCFQKKSLPVLSKQHSAFREQLFEAKWCFWREYVVMLFMLSGRWENNFGCSPNPIRHLCQILTPRVQSNVFRKHRFFKKTKFFWQF